MRGTVLLLAAGRGTRLALGPKAFERLAGRTLLRRAADAAASATLVERVVAAVPPSLLAEARVELDGLARAWIVVAGGATRQESSRLALEAAGQVRAVAVHDAARPLCPPALFDACLSALDDVAASCAAVPLTDTVKEVDGSTAVRTPDRSTLVAVQTPQAFHADVLRAAHASALEDGATVTDDAALVERTGVRVRVVAGSPSNIKVTTAFDLQIAEALLRCG